MMRRCDGTDPNLKALDGTPCDCGLVFDDVQITTTWPHHPVGPKPTPAKLDALLTEMFMDMESPGRDVQSVIPNGDDMVTRTNWPRTPVTRVIRHTKTPHLTCDQETTTTAAGVMVIHRCSRYTEHVDLPTDTGKRHICPCRFTWGSPE